MSPGFRGDPNLKGEQRQALEFVLRSPDEVIGLRGRAGAGKTQLLQALVGALAEGKGQAAFGRLDRLGAVEQLDDDTRYRTLAVQFVASVKAGKSALVVSPTWREIEEVTGEVRAQLRDAGLLGT